MSNSKIYKYYVVLIDGIIASNLNLEVNPSVTLNFKNPVEDIFDEEWKPASIYTSKKDALTSLLTPFVTLNTQSSFEIRGCDYLSRDINEWTYILSMPYNFAEINYLLEEKSYPAWDRFYLLYSYDGVSSYYHTIEDKLFFSDVYFNVKLFKDFVLSNQRKVTDIRLYKATYQDQVSPYNLGEDSQTLVVSFKSSKDFLENYQAITL